MISESTAGSTRVDAALQYAARGWHVLPLHYIRNGGCSCGKSACTSPGKHPFSRLVPHGAKDASDSATVIERWWADVPEANIGIATGPSGLVVIDVDGPQGAVQLKRELGALEPTLAARTGREGGWHLYYKGAVPSSQVKGEHLDVRGTTGYVVAPGSNHISGRDYVWVDQRALIAAVPDCVGAWVARRRGKGQAIAPAKTPVMPAYLGTAQPAARLADRAPVLSAEPWSQHEEARLRAALACIPANLDGATWYAYGAAIHDLGWVNGIDLFDEWSSQSEGKGAGNGEYRGRADIEKRWQAFGAKSYTGKRATVASIFGRAKELGWNGEIIVEPKDCDDSIKPQMNGHHALPASFTADPIVFPDTDKAGNPKQTCRNARAALLGLGITCEHDTFHGKMLLGGKPIDQYAGELSDEAVQMLRVLIERRFDFDPGLVNCHDAAVQECLQKPFDPVAAYLDGVAWDRKPRLGSWLSTYMGAEPSRLTSVVGVLALAAAVRRVRVPGAKFDQIIVLESPEGRGKSTAIEILAGANNFSDQSILTMDDKSQQEAIQGVWLYEIADLAGMSKADVEKVKAFASRKVDRARPAYGRARVDRPRRCVFFATTNNETYLKSQTGNRRFWPVRVNRIDIEGLARDRDQIWAEAVAAEKVARDLTMPANLWGDITAIQDMRMDEDPWHHLIADIQGKEAEGAKGREWRISSRDIFELHLRLGAERMTDAAAKRVCYLMRRAGWVGPAVFRDNGILRRGYIKHLEAWARGEKA